MLSHLHYYGLEIFSADYVVSPSLWPYLALLEFFTEFIIVSEKIIQFT